MALHIWYPLTIALYLVALWNVTKVLGSRTTPGAAFGWIFFHLALPMFAVPLYWLIGDFRIKGYVRRHRAAVKLIDAHEEHMAKGAPSPDVDAVAPELRRTYGPMKTMFERFGDVFSPQPGAVGLLVDGNATFKAIFDAIKGADRYILVQYYIVRSDRLGLELKRLLIEKARAGVPVYMLLNDMVVWLSRGYIADLKASGVRIARFLPMASFKRFFQLNFRNHRKLVVIDGNTAFTGGLNVGEEYVGRKSDKSRLRYWRDTHVSLTGRPVAHMQDIFEEDWYFATGELIALPKATKAPPSEQLAAQAYDSLVQVVPTGPTDEAILSVLYIMQLIASAEQRLWIATPYFVPDPAIMRVVRAGGLSRRRRTTHPAAALRQPASPMGVAVLRRAANPSRRESDVLHARVHAPEGAADRRRDGVGRDHEHGQSGAVSQLRDHGHGPRPGVQRLGGRHARARLPGLPVPSSRQRSETSPVPAETPGRCRQPARPLL